MNTGEKKGRNKNNKLFKGGCKKCGKFCHRALDCWVNNNKNNNINENRTARKPRFNGECKNCGKRVHKAVDCWAKKGKEKDDDVDNLFMGATLCGEVQEDNNEEDPKEWLGDSGASSHITHKKKDMTEVKKCEINIAVENGMSC